MEANFQFSTPTHNKRKWQKVQEMRETALQNGLLDSNQTE